MPVVLGAHPADYKAVAPFKSYISVEDFQFPRHLAEYLKFLDGNDTLYNEYFRWKSTGYFYDAWADFFCRACGMLHYADYVAPPQWEEETLWRSISYCLPNRQWHWIEQ